MKKQTSIERRESLVSYAKSTGIAVPIDLYDQSGQYPHWELYCNIQLERPIFSLDAPLHNAQIISAIPSSRLLSTAEPFRFEDISNQLK